MTTIWLSSVVCMRTISQLRRLINVLITAEADYIPDSSVWNRATKQARTVIRIPKRLVAAALSEQLARTAVLLHAR